MPRWHVVIDDVYFWDFYGETIKEATDAYLQDRGYQSMADAAEKLGVTEEYLSEGLQVVPYDPVWAKQWEGNKCYGKLF